MSLLDWLRRLFREAQPLLRASEEFAEKEGLALVRQVQTEIANKTGPELIALFNATVGARLGFTASGLLTPLARSLLITALARAKAEALAPSSMWRVSVLYAGIELAVLLLKAEQGDTDPLGAPVALL